MDDPGQAFAAVTICSHAAKRFDRIAEPLLKFINERNITFAGDLTNLSPVQFQHVPEVFDNRVNRNESVKEFFYELVELLIDCNSNLVPCSAADLVSF